MGNDKNFNSIMQDTEDDIWMVKFSAPWCTHCVKMKDDWVKSAEKLKGKVRFADIDVSENKGMAKRFGIKYLPEIKYFNGLNEIGDELDTADFDKYSGSRKADAIITFAKELHAA